MRHHSTGNLLPIWQLRDPRCLVIVEQPGGVHQARREFVVTPVLLRRLVTRAAITADLSIVVSHHAVAAQFAYPFNTFGWMRAIADDVAEEDYGPCAASLYIPQHRVQCYQVRVNGGQNGDRGM